MTLLMMATKYLQCVRQFMQIVHDLQVFSQWNKKTFKKKASINLTAYCKIDLSIYVCTYICIYECVWKCIILLYYSGIIVAFVKLLRSGWLAQWRSVIEEDHALHNYVTSFNQLLVFFLPSNVALSFTFKRSFNWLTMTG